MLYSIGEFSKISQLSVKALRFYHEKGLLIPAEIESETGYRFYSQDQIAVARRIATLKKLGLSLAVIERILHSCDDDADLLALLSQQKDELNLKIQQQRATIKSINQIISKERQAMKVNQESIEEKQLEDMLIAGYRMTGKYSEIGEGFKKLGPVAGRHINGKALGLHYCGEYQEIAEFEACFPVRKSVEGEGIDCRVIEGGRALTIIHRGPYETIGESYEALINEIKTQGLETKLPSREVYIKGPGMIFTGNPEKYITEIQILVES